jgi:hypothetical protein
MKATDSYEYDYLLVAFNRKSGNIIYTEDVNKYMCNQAIVYRHKLYLSGYGSSIFELGNTVKDIQQNEFPMNQFILSPNPATDFITFRFDVPYAGSFTLYIYDLSGKEVKIIYENKWLSEGNYSETIQIPKDVEPGMYLLTFKSSKAIIGAKIAIEK